MSNAFIFIMSVVKWRCPAYKCLVVGKEGYICPKHKIKLVKTVTGDTADMATNRFWITTANPYKRKSLKSFIRSAKSQEAGY